MDYVQPADLLNDAIKAALRKASLSIRDLLIRSFLAGGLLAYATSLVFTVLSHNIVPIVGAILFPVGFVILVLLGFESATGNLRFCLQDGRRAKSLSRRLARGSS